MSKREGRWARLLSTSAPTGDGCSSSAGQGSSSASFKSTAPFAAPSPPSTSSSKGGVASFSLYAFNAQGKPLWTSTQTISIDSSPAIGPTLIYFGSLDHNLHAIDLQGHDRWTFRTGAPVWSYATGGAVTSSPAIGPRGEVVVGSRDGKVYLFQ